MLSATDACDNGTTGDGATLRPLDGESESSIGSKKKPGRPTRGGESRQYPLASERRFDQICSIAYKERGRGVSHAIFQHEPEDVVSRLDALFVIFERITTKHGLEKIKTIGDGFMAAAGLLHHVADPIGSAVRCGLEMASTMIDAHLGWEVRVGGHSGPVVAGVVGQERYQFDIWGDTVNVAARMVGMSAPGSVATTKEVWEMISTAFDGEALGELEINGKGRVSVFGLRPCKP
jgi:class 3 adenylate cyclase